jgi:hypothetical protein
VAQPALRSQVSVLLEQVSVVPPQKPAVQKSPV